MTTEEAERLSLMLMNNYDKHVSGFTMSLEDEGQNLWLEGRVDFREHMGYANLLVDSSPATYSLVQWNFESVGAAAAQSQGLPEQPPQELPWQGRALEPDISTLDTGLSLLLNLASDRPENPVLMQQNGAQWHGKATVGETTVDVLSGPGEDNTPSDSLLYFVDADGNLTKVIADMPRTENDAIIEFTNTTTESIDSPLAD